MTNDIRKIQSELTSLDDKIREAREQLDRFRMEHVRVSNLRQMYTDQLEQRLLWVSHKFKKEIRRQSHSQVYRTELMVAHGKNVPLPFLLLLQTRLLRCFHMMEVYRSQWKIAANNFIRMTQRMMHQVLIVKNQSLKSVAHEVKTIHPYLDSDFKMEKLRHVINDLTKSMMHEELHFGHLESEKMKSSNGPNSIPLELFNLMTFDIRVPLTSRAA